MIEKTTLFSLPIICLLLLFAPSAMAQGATATLFGNVADSTGALVGTASVTATNLNNKKATTAPTNDQGEYRLDLLPVGRYSITVTAQGFKNFVQKNINLTVDQRGALST